MSSTTNQRALSGSLLIAGTTIGAGMLAMPVVTADMGFLPSLIVNFFCWLTLALTALLFLEVTLWMDDEANLVSMTDRFLGKTGKWFGTIAFLFLHYSLLVGYFSAGSTTVLQFFEHSFGGEIATLPIYLSFALILFTVVSFGLAMVDRVNLILMMGLIGSYVGLMLTRIREVSTETLTRANWGLTLSAAPTLISAYGFHSIIPSIATYLKRDVIALRRSILYGSFIAFMIYSLWQWLLLGAIPYDQLKTSLNEGKPVTQALIALQQVTLSSWVPTLGLYFSFFALITSVLGVSFSTVDFIADGLKVSQCGKSRFGICFVVFFPPMILSIIYPGIFLTTMAYAGGFGETTLNCILPIAMVYVGYHKMNLKIHTPWLGNKMILIALSTITLLIMGLEVFHLLTPHK